MSSTHRSNPEGQTQHGDCAFARWACMVFPPCCRLRHALQTLQMPDELFYDPQVIELREEIKGLQAEFVTSHKALDAAQQHVK